jgi:glycosyltransferase involved in cell wall biosynthesis
MAFNKCLALFFRLLLRRFTKVRCMEKIRCKVLQALIITKNEEPNIERVLNKLSWLEKIVVLDSYSTDATLDILCKFPNVVVYHRAFDSFANQCNYGLSLIDSEWVISLDADYVLTDSFIAETKRLLESDDKNITAYNTRFRFLVYGKQLRTNNTTPRPVLFKKSKCSYFDDGHAHRLQISGNQGFFKSFILHDDRKPLTRWLNNLNGYSVKECQKLINPHNPGRHTLTTKIRKTKVLAPFIVFFYCLLVKGLLLNGWAGWHYTIQRTMVEMLFALRLIEEEKLKV